MKLKHISSSVPSPNCVAELTFIPPCFQRLTSFVESKTQWVTSLSPGSSTFCRGGYPPGP